MWRWLRWFAAWRSLLTNAEGDRETVRAALGQAARVGNLTMCPRRGEWQQVRFFQDPLLHARYGRCGELLKCKRDPELGTRIYQHQEASSCS